MTGTNDPEGTEHESQYPDQVVDVKRTVKVPQAQLIDKVVKVPDLTHRQVPMSQGLWERSSAWG